MRFLSSIDNMVYVVRPKDILIDSLGIRRRVVGLRAEFTNHIFDSEAAQRKLRWSEEERQAVENYLQEHPDFNRRSNTEAGLSPRLFLEGAGFATKAKAETAGSSQNLRCIFTFPTEDGGAEQCGRKATKGYYCGRHAPKQETVPGPEAVPAATT